MSQSTPPNVERANFFQRSNLIEMTTTTIIAEFKNIRKQEIECIRELKTWHQLKKLKPGAEILKVEDDNRLPANFRQSSWVIKESDGRSITLSQKVAGEVRKTVNMLTEHSIKRLAPYPKRYFLISQ
jgi:hypothetical protein